MRFVLSLNDMKHNTDDCSRMKPDNKSIHGGVVTCSFYYNQQLIRNQSECSRRREDTSHSRLIPGQDPPTHLREMPLAVTIHSWRTVADWKWLGVPDDDVCAICMNPYEGCCHKCKLPGDNCPLVMGVCSHVFHMHCIEEWLETNDVPQCPKDRTDWAVKT
ncbi:hypothetical protein BASA50_009066 [Batrachochytrium salamandrivorans]|uniref:Anaphase-promoting complex subunit 11 n=1 Tax=Batrachochytrium salamandrivorans TaxID=1357716 RepID=A0ABQ8F2Q6_9FUNG|nr:hypothetical protein BASA50_009066 [Batrachochytrium salamandrivorans]KAH9268785.1 hypothetical protein BASA84_000016 [Batrachochytrium salamandrivorans]